MNTKNILAGIVVLAALLVTPTLFSSCSKDEGKNESEAALNTLVIDGVETPITRAGIDEYRLKKNQYVIALNYADDLLSGFGIILIPDPNIPVVDLTQKATGRNNSWLISYSIDGEDIFFSTDNPKSGSVLFDTGTLSIRRLNDAANGNPVFEVVLKDGKIKDAYDGDRKVHTVSLYYKGEMKLTSFSG